MSRADVIEAFAAVLADNILADGIFFWSCGCFVSAIYNFFLVAGIAWVIVFYDRQESHKEVP